MPPSPDSNQSNPAWSRDELVLALNLYLLYRNRLPSVNHPEVRALSESLNLIGNVTGVSKNQHFRNPNSVYMKLSNFSRWDPSYTNTGRKSLVKGNKDEELVWLEFANNPKRLAEVVATIKANVETVYATPLALSVEEEPGFFEAEEGKVLTRVHRVRERDKKLVKRKKDEALKKHGVLQCEACGFNFSKTYGPDVEGVIDVHHTKPLHTLQPGDKTKLADLALLCANCHRVVHSRRKWLSVTEVKDRYLAAKNKA
ncbi:HNH endonuclease [Pseudomonas sp. 21TX0197]|uniref:HNH endonuclease n=1 Tax=Pseudomonas sp. 21TX0197 TaxID=2972639 RepID=UPI00232CEAC1|nr:HNH endonuclease [Pseudomonas sp. 21TX0197]MDB6444049.1 HNH endonuclease [Pseudomonas sp. 21TX0197]